MSGKASKVKDTVSADQVNMLFALPAYGSGEDIEELAFIRDELAREAEHFLEVARANLAVYIAEVIFHDPHTTIVFIDGSKVRVTAMRGDKFDKTIGFYSCLAKALFGSHALYKRLIASATEYDPKFLKKARASRKNKK